LRMVSHYTILVFLKQLLARRKRPSVVQPLLLTIPNVAIQLEVCRATVYNLMYRSGLPYIALNASMRNLRNIEPRKRTNSRYQAEVDKPYSANLLWKHIQRVTVFEMRLAQEDCTHGTDSEGEPASPGVFVDRKDTVYCSAQHLLTLHHLLICQRPYADETSAHSPLLDLSSSLTRSGEYVTHALERAPIIPPPRRERRLVPRTEVSE
jgi:hypothetical protein